MKTRRISDIENKLNESFKSSESSWSESQDISSGGSDSGELSNLKMSEPINLDHFQENKKQLEISVLESDIDIEDPIAEDSSHIYKSTIKTLLQNDTEKSISLDTVEKIKRENRSLSKSIGAKIRELKRAGSGNAKKNVRKISEILNYKNSIASLNKNINQIVDEAILTKERLANMKMAFDIALMKNATQNKISKQELEDSIESNDTWKAADLMKDLQRSVVVNTGNTNFTSINLIEKEKNLKDSESQTNLEIPLPVFESEGRISCCYKCPIM
ncbi:unnamed protein product [Blepharisma stoltei]|uniref:Uncharacterized protein n=1 Tax=Blepharisma stoltei TaxID=1481888 RepID=A0AAU9J360_9CILI|nr:unnamed protein product [Blepharisma stoltei]